METGIATNGRVDRSVSRFGQVRIGEDFRFSIDGQLFRRTQGSYAQPVDCIGGHRSIYGGSTIHVSRTESVLPTPG